MTGRPELSHVMLCYAKIGIQPSPLLIQQDAYVCCMTYRSGLLATYTEFVIDF